MAGGAAQSLRALPRVFLPGIELDAGEVELPEAELNKLRRVLRLSSGDQLAVLPNDGRIARCELRGKIAKVLEVERPAEHAVRHVILVMGLPKPDGLETSFRMCTEMGVAGFGLFPADRSVVKWEPEKMHERLRRLSTIAREAAEVCGRLRLPAIELYDSLGSMLSKHPSCIVLSEREDCRTTLEHALPVGDGEAVLVVGPEGGWSPKESHQIGGRAATLGKLVLRVATAAACACARALPLRGGG